MTQFGVKALSIQMHEEYNKETLVNDICILKFPPMRLNKFAAPACLPADGQHPAPGTLCWAAGWGKTGDKWTSSTNAVLHEVDLKIISDSVCQKTENKNDLVIGKMFCAGYLDGTYIRIII